MSFFFHFSFLFLLWHLTLVLRLSLKLLNLFVFIWSCECQKGVICNQYSIQTLHVYINSVCKSNNLNISTWSLTSTCSSQDIQQLEAFQKFFNIWQFICQIHLTTLSKLWKIVKCCHFCVVFFNQPFCRIHPRFQQAIRFCLTRVWIHVSWDSLSSQAHQKLPISSKDEHSTKHG